MVGVALGVALAGCARIEPPPGGPEDRSPPTLVAVLPDSLATVPSFRGEVVFEFDERISEQGVEDAVSVSPRTSPVAVDHSGGRIRVSLRRGWEPGQVYQVRIAPTIRDLFSNVLPAPIELIFSTGPAIPDTRIAGTVLDRITGQPEAAARVEAIRAADSLVYATATDSTGAWTLRRFPAGAYRVRAFRDANRNREPDPFEPQDSQTVQVAGGAAAAAPIALRLLLPDSTPPAVASARAADGVVEVQFDDYLDPAQPLIPTQLRVTGPAGAVIRVGAVRLGTAPPVAADTARAEPVAAPLPSRSLFARLAAPLAPGAEYRVQVNGVRNVNGLQGGGEDTFETPAAPQVQPSTQPQPRSQ